MSKQIPITEIHECNKFCAFMHVYEEINEHLYTEKRILNPTYIDGKCEKFGQPVESSVFLHSYQDFRYCNENENVISDTNIKIQFDYPLSNKFLFEFRSKSSDGFTMRELIENICKTYYKIYEIEKQTAMDNHYTFKTKCNKCHREKMENDTFEVVNSNIENECSICLSSYEIGDLCAKLVCNHQYHKKCIDKWFDENITCPLCRKDNVKLIKCGNCNDGLLTVEFTGKVLPIEMRRLNNGLLNRNQTNGMYGIWGHDIEDLSIDGLNYNTQTKTLFLGMGS